MEKLSCLEKLCTIGLNEEGNSNDDILRSISKLTRLRKVDIRGVRSRDAKELCSTLDKLTELRSLYIGTIGDEPMDLEPVSSPPKYLQTLYVKAKMEKLPQWITSLLYLTKLILSHSGLKEDALEKFGELPNLTYLQLFRNAYIGEEMCFKEGTFKQLITLQLYWLFGPRRVRVMKGALPRLEKLTIGDCKSMDEIPTGIETLSSSVSLLEFRRMSDEFTSKLRRELRENRNTFSQSAHISKVVVNGEVF